MVTLGLGFLAFRFIIIPTINEQLETTQEIVNEAAEKISKIGRFAGKKSADYEETRNLEALIGMDIVNSQIPEIALLKTFLSPSTWETVEETIQENPEQILALYQKYGHLLKAVGGQGQDSDQPMF